MFKNTRILTGLFITLGIIGAFLAFPAISAALTNQPVPGQIEAESYSAMSGIQTETCSEGGLDVGWVDAGDWMDYSLNVQATGTYSVDFRVSSPYANTQFQLKNGSTILATITVPNTGGYQTWTTVTTTNINLTAGSQTLRVSAVTNGWNINWLKFNLNGTVTPTPAATPVRTSTPTRTPTLGPTPTSDGNLALRKTATASSYENTVAYPANNVVDGNTTTRWSSAFSDPQWIYVDLGAVYPVNKVVLNWEAAFGKSYQIQVSSDAVNWFTVWSTTTGTGGIVTATFMAVNARYVRMNGTVRGTGYGYSLYEFEVYGSGSVTPTASPTPAATPTPTLRPTETPTPTLTPTPTPSSGPADFGPNVYIFDPSMSAATIQSRCDTLINQQASNQFGSQRYALLFKPGSYNVNVSVGFYTSVIGLGQRPDDVTITGSVRCEADWMNGNATCNFWRTVENLADIPTYVANSSVSPGTETWAASQAAPMRRVHIKGGLSLWDPVPPNYDGAWSSGGFIADSIIDGTIGSASQQQYFTRNSQMGAWNGANWNMVFVGNLGAPANTWPDPPNTVVGQTPVIREKPFLYIDSAGKYYVFVPSLRSNSQGVAWASGTGQGTSISIDQFYIAKPGIDTAASINAAISQGKNLLLTPGIYQLTEPIQVTRANTVVLGIGLPTLMPVNGTAAMKIADVDGVSLAGILFDAGATNSPVLLEVGPSGSSLSHASNPTFLYDIFCRVGGAAAGKADVCITINSNNVVGDDFWLWRADHGADVGWTTNTATNGLIVNGSNVTFYGLFVEHFQQYQTVWNGNGGRTYFYQSECPYDAPNQSAWQHNGINGWASYKVADSVTTHEAWGLGVYCVYTVDLTIKCNSGIEAPVNSGVKIHHMVTVSLGGQGEITHVINNTGGPSNSATNVAKVNEFP